ncbi:siderophore-interacting protein [Shinella curvata]|uniref:Siderophore-interacting protein n=1 Tax=Shinella curvata TaxID=1817964 RepID=A0ABT8XEV4_9HYPH|nr:siderophore-interacting protein [Shinella curvata]MCJ8052890.1 siderophore-interacting protein [Shinella curvata]MDO6122221.1 siderophore-interacting protein [Shinella curvata]
MQTREYTAKARIALRNPGPVIAEFCDHMLEHNAEVNEGPDGPVLRLGHIRAAFSRDGAETLVAVAAPDLEGLYLARMSVASHILEFAGDDPPVIEWTGDGGEIARPPNFQILDVVGCRMLTPHMRRLTLSGEDVARFAGLEALHLNLMIQRPEAGEPQWPHVGANGVIAWDDPGLRPLMRKYTVRSVDLAAGTLDIDFVLHADAGPGSGFAQAAAVGDRVGVVGPGGGGLVEAEWYLFAGDETALPAIARMLEHLPTGARGKVFLEVADAAEVQPLTTTASLEIEWLLRNGRPAGGTTLLMDAIRNTDFPTSDQRRYLWAGCEFEAFRAIRTFARQEKRLANTEHLVVSYWRRGAAEAE